MHQTEKGVWLDINQIDVYTSPSTFTISVLLRRPTHKNTNIYLHLDAIQSFLLVEWSEPHLLNQYKEKQRDETNLPLREAKKHFSYTVKLRIVLKEIQKGSSWHLGHTFESWPWQHLQATFDTLGCHSNTKNDNK